MVVAVDVAGGVVCCWWCCMLLLVVLYVVGGIVCCLCGGVVLSNCFPCSNTVSVDVFITLPVSNDQDLLFNSHT